MCCKRTDFEQCYKIHIVRYPYGIVDSPNLLVVWLAAVFGGSNLEC